MIFFMMRRGPEPLEGRIANEKRGRSPSKEELNYPLVNFLKKPQHRRAARIKAPRPAATVTAVVINGVRSDAKAEKSMRLVMAAFAGEATPTTTPTPTAVTAAVAETHPFSKYFFPFSKHFFVNSNIGISPFKVVGGMPDKWLPEETPEAEPSTVDGIGRDPNPKTERNAKSDLCDKQGMHVTPSK